MTETLDIADPNVAEEIAKQIEAGDFDAATSVKDLIESIPAARGLIVAAGFRALGARKWFFEKGKTEKVFEPDFKTQLAAAQWLAGYSDGLPTQTTLNVNVNKDAPSKDDVMKRVAESPALKAALQEALGEKQ